MLAHSVAPKLAGEMSAHSFYIYKSTASEDEDLESPPLDETQLLLLEQQGKPCVCNRFYTLRTKIALLINHYIPRCPYYTPCFAFRRSGVHPPLFSL